MFAKAKKNNNKIKPNGSIMDANLAKSRWQHLI